ncbi:hypothetical protein M9Y10_019144 [Tritrichomonas musculus]|uniref:Uncharacterized protein n=1 Tax=Tritrichomonas musculus TaxID=1915356 RepID=A0ABR2HJK2_9EUKA
MRAKFKIDEHESIDNLLVARRLAQFCPTSLSIDDFQSRPSKSSSTLSLKSPISSADNLIETTKKVEYIAPSPSVKVESLSSNNIAEPKSAFKLGIQPAKHRFGFLLADIKPIENKINVSNSCSNMSPNKPFLKMRYELPNVKKVDTPIRSTKPLMVISFSSANLNNTDNNINNNENFQRKSNVEEQ